MKDLIQKNRDYQKDFNKNILRFVSATLTTCHLFFNFISRPHSTKWLCLMRQSKPFAAKFSLISKQ
jgi:hypothetical protein